MKRILFATAIAVATMVSAPAFAQGFVGAQAAHTEVDAGPVSVDGNVYDVFGKVVTPLNDTLAFQFDGDVNWNDIEGLDHSVAGGGAVHLYRETPANKLGVFGGVAAEDGDNMWYGGAEAQVYPSDNFDLAVSLGYFNDDEVDVEGWTLGGTGTLFLNDNFDVFANAGFGRADVLSMNDVKGWDAGVGLEYQLSGAPISFYGAYDHTDLDDLDAKADTVSVGVTYSWSGSLKERQHRGPSLPGLSGVAGAFKF